MKGPRRNLYQGDHKTNQEAPGLSAVAGYTHGGVTITRRSNLPAQPTLWAGECPQVSSLVSGVRRRVHP